MNNLFSIKAIWWRKESLSTNGARKIGYQHAKKKVIYFYPYFTSYTKTNSKWFTDLYIKSEIKKLLGENLCHHGLGKDFLDTTLKSIKDSNP